MGENIYNGPYGPDHCGICGMYTGYGIPFCEEHEERIQQGVDQNPDHLATLHAAYKTANIEHPIVNPRSDDWYNQTVPVKLVEFARKIAMYRGYDNLENGLQPIAVLQAKYEHERNDELKDALDKGESLHVLHEISDVLYYAACLDAQIGSGDWEKYSRTLFEIRRKLAGRGILPKLEITQAQIEAAALAKYAWRSAGPNNKDEAYELQLIEQSTREHISDAIARVSSMSDADLIAESEERSQKHRELREAGKAPALEAVEVGVVVNGELVRRGYAIVSGEGWKKLDILHYD